MDQKSSNRNNLKVIFVKGDNFKIKKFLKQKARIEFAGWDSQLENASKLGVCSEKLLSAGLRSMLASIEARGTFARCCLLVVTPDSIWWKATYRHQR